MPFPVTIDAATYVDPQSLGRAVVQQAMAGGVPHLGLARAAASGDLSRDEAVGLSAALIQSGRPFSVVTGERLAQALGDPALCRLLLLAHDALDIGTLLQSMSADTSVEDVLLGAAASLVGESDAHRADVLPRLRHAGLGADEVRVLALHGTADEIRRGLPAVLLEGLPPNTADALARGMKRGLEVADALLDVLAALPRGARAALWAAATRHGVHHALPEAQSRLFADAAEE